MRWIYECISSPTKLISRSGAGFRVVAAHCRSSYVELYTCALSRELGVAEASPSPCGLASLTQVLTVKWPNCTQLLTLCRKYRMKHVAAIVHSDDASMHHRNHQESSNTSGVKTLVEVSQDREEPEPPSSFFFSTSSSNNRETHPSSCRCLFTKQVNFLVWRFPRGNNDV